MKSQSCEVKKSKSQEQVIFENCIKSWMRKPKQRLNPLEEAFSPICGQALWWKIKRNRPGEHIMFYPTGLIDAVPDPLKFLYNREIECYAYTIDGKEVTR